MFHIGNFEAKSMQILIQSQLITPKTSNTLAMQISQTRMVLFWSPSV